MVQEFVYGVIRNDIYLYRCLIILFKRQLTNPKYNYSIVLTLLLFYNFIISKALKNKN